MDIKERPGALLAGRARKRASTRLSCDERGGEDLEGSGETAIIVASDVSTLPQEMSVKRRGSNWLTLSGKITK
jgi:hypothetical protein